MLTSFALLVPTLPTLLVDEHRGHHSPMLAALAAAAERLTADAPAAVVVLSARWCPPRGPFLADDGRRHGTLTDYHGFGVEVRYDCAGLPSLARAIVEGASRAGVRAANAQRGVDSAVSVPMHFLAPDRRWPVVPVSIAPSSAAECRAWGTAIAAAIAAWPERVAFVVGGLLSNNAHAWSLRREVPEARAFDDRTLESLGRGVWSDLAPHGRGTAEAAQPDAGLRHLEVLRGVLGRDAPGEVRCYEAAPGIGAALIEFPLGVETPAG